MFPISVLASLKCSYRNTHQIPTSLVSCLWQYVVCTSHTSNFCSVEDQSCVGGRCDYLYESIPILVPNYLVVSFCLMLSNALLVCLFLCLVERERERERDLDCALPRSL